MALGDRQVPLVVDFYAAWCAPSHSITLPSTCCLGSTVRAGIYLATRAS